MSAQAAVHQAVYTLLRADAGLALLLAADPAEASPTRPAVFDHVPQAPASESGDRFPYVTIGETTAGEFDTDLVDGQETTITLHVWDRRRGRKKVQQVLDAIYNALHNVDLSVSGQHAVYCFWEFSQTLQEDGPNSQHAVTRFRIVTQES